jgi:hypothetical protein
MIDVPACISSMEDVFDGPAADQVVGETVEQRQMFVETQEQLTKKYQGQAFRAYLEKRVPDQSAISALATHMSNFNKASPLPDQQAWLGRIRKVFALCYASAAQAIDYVILPWSKKATLDAIRTCMNDAMQQMQANEDGGHHSDEPTNNSDHSLLLGFRNKVDNASFVHLAQARRTSKNLAKKLRNADGLIRRQQSGRVQYLLFSKVLEQWYPESTIRRRLVSLARSHRIFRRGRRPDTTTRQIYIAELKGKISCYVFSRKRLQNVCE